MAAEAYGHRVTIPIHRLRRTAPIIQPVRPAVRATTPVTQAEDHPAIAREERQEVHLTARHPTVHRATVLRHPAEATAAEDVHRHLVHPALQAVALHQEAVAADALHPVAEDNNTEYITG